MNTTRDNGKIDLVGIDHEAVAEGVSQAGMGIIVVLTALIGAWGLACLIGGLGKSAGLLEVTRGWLTAVSGM